jgi:FlaA1/EpsC-like NDP-sugar epimerase
MHPRSILALLHDVSAVAVAWLAAYWLRFNLDIPANYLEQAVTMLPWILPVNLTIFWLTGLYRGIWRYSSLHDLQRILLSVAAAALFVIAGIYISQKTPVPRSVLILYPMLLVGFMGGSRLLYRVWKERSLYGGMRGTQKPVLVIGAGDAAADLLRELARSVDWHVVGLLDDSRTKRGLQINGVRVLGEIDQVGSIARSLEVSNAIVAMPGATAANRRRAMELAAAAGLTVLTVPAFSDLLSGKFAISQVRAVELEDLLGRDRIELDEAGLHRLLAGKSILVTGAGGSIGSELCRQIVRFGHAGWCSSNSRSSRSTASSRSSPGSR